MVKSTPAEAKLPEADEASPSPAPVASGAPVRAVKIEVTVNSDGSLRAAHLARSSGSAEFDAAALERAYKANYVAASKDCKPIQGTVLLDIDPPKAL